MADNAKVMFKRGLQANLPTTGLDGSFYLTTDTNRLYIAEGSESNNLKLLNQTVQIIATEKELSDLTDTWTTKKSHINDFYYITELNALAVYLQTAENTYEWVQINPDHDTKVTSGSVTTTASGNTVNLKTTLVLTGGTSVPIESSLTAAGGISISNSGSNITLTGETYDFGFVDPTTTESESMSAKLQLTSSVEADTDYVGFVGDKGIEISADKTSKVLTIKNTKKGLEGGTLTTSYNNTTGKLGVTVVDGYTQSVTNSTDLYVKVGKGGTVTKNLNGDLDVYTTGEVDQILQDLNGLTFIGNIGAADSTTTAYKFNSSGKVVDSDNNAVSIHSGDMFMIAEDLELPDGTNATLGDLIIAGGTENDETGVIASPTWNYIPTGDKGYTNTEYQLATASADNKVSLLTKGGSNSGSVIFAGDFKSASGDTDESGILTVITTLGTKTVDGKSVTDTNNSTVTISHKTFETITPTTASSTVADTMTNGVTAITGIDRDNYGHITGYTTTTFGINKYTLNNQVAPYPGASGTLTGAVDTITLIDKTNATQNVKAQIGITSNSLTVTADTTNSKIDIDIEWGSF